MAGMDDELLVHALTSDGVAELRTGGDQECQRIGWWLILHSYPAVGGEGDPCACGKTRRGPTAKDQ